MDAISAFFAAQVLEEGSGIYKEQPVAAFGNSVISRSMIVDMHLDEIRGLLTEN